MKIRIIITIIGFIFDLIGLLDRRVEIGVIGVVIGLVDISTFIWLYKKRTVKEILEEMYL